MMYFVNNNNNNKTSAKNVLIFNNNNQLLFPIINAMSRTLTTTTTCFIIVFLIIIAAPTTFSDKNFDFKNRSNSIIKRGRYTPAAADTNSDDQLPIPTQSSSLYNCGSCKMREDIKNRNLEVIKHEVLRRMGFQSAPNFTGRVIPSVPLHMLAKVDHQHDFGGGGGMQSDEPPQYKSSASRYSVSEEDDDYHVKTEEVLAFAQPCKFDAKLLLASWSEMRCHVYFT